MFARTPMASHVSEVLLSLLSEYGGGALDLVRRGCSAIRGWFGNLGALVRPLLKEGLAFLASKLRSGAAVVREKTKRAGSELLRLAEAFLGKRTEREPEPTAAPEAPMSKKEGDSATCAPAPSATPATQKAADASMPSSTKVARPEFSAEPMTRDIATTLGPVLGRALVRAFSRPRAARVAPLNGPLAR